MERLTIIITAYNRANGLRNVLSSLKKIVANEEVDLIISIDNNGTIEVNSIANEFVWSFGKKTVIIHKQKKGLVNHFIWVGDQTMQYGNIIFLEDDLFVSKHLIDVSKQLLEFYKNDDLIAGVSLYSPLLCEFDSCKFFPNNDGYDVYFFQHPYWGNIWSKDKWELFKKWFLSYQVKYHLIPDGIAYQTNSFKKIFIQYLVETSRFIVYPRMSIVTNMGEKGLHSRSLDQFQTTLLNSEMKLKLCHLNDSNSIYDSFMEILPEIVKRNNTLLKTYDFEVDLRGLKKIYNCDLVLTTRPTSNALLKFTGKMKPIESGVLNNVSGVDVFLTSQKNILNNKKYFKMRLYNDINLNYLISLRVSIIIFIESIKNKFKDFFK